MALWPIHARMSPTNDEGSLIALLVISSLALVIAAGRTKSSLLLVCGWIAGCLGATIKPEVALALPPIGILVLVMPETRR